MKQILRNILVLVGLALAAACSDPVAECKSPSEYCDGVCVSPNVDRENCGACGNTCSANQVCSDGACVCPAGKELCDGRCVDLRTDSRNCGACGVACEEGNFCRDSECCVGDDCACPGEICDGACVDTQADELNCGACGNECGAGQHCFGGTCAAGDVFAACFQSGRIVPLLGATGQTGGTIATGVDGPQSLALMGDKHLVVIGGIDDTLYVFDRATMKKVGSLALGEEGGGRMPNQVLVQGDRAIVVNSGVNTVQVIDLSNPAAPRSRCEVSTGENTSPALATFGADGTLWVSLLAANQVVPVTLGDDTCVLGATIALPTDGLGPNPFPGQIAIHDGILYVAMNNLAGDWSPFGNGVVAVVDPDADSVATIDLGSDCTNPGFSLLDGDELVVSCTGAYGMDDGAIAVVDLGDESVRVVHTGGGPSRLSQGAHLYAGNSAAGTYFRIDGDEATAFEACPESPFEFVSDVLAIP